MHGKSTHVLFAGVVMALDCTHAAAAAPSFPVGMNIQGLSYYSTPIFNDVMTASSDWITFYEGSAWNTGKRDLLTCDENGYPVEIPQTIDGQATMVRMMLNNCYSGRYRVTWRGEGDIVWRVPHEETAGRHYISLDGSCEHRWIEITRSKRGDHIRAIRVLPDSLADSYDPANPEHLFLPLFLDGLRPFHAIRFMDWCATNGSAQKSWSKRPKPGDFSQGVKGICIEYAIALCNYLGVDGWFCVPHAADDGYIMNFAQMVRDGLHPALKAYVEYSNEIWNWDFGQSQWACSNGRWGDTALFSPDSLRDQLAAVGNTYCGNSSDECVCHPEKDAHLMARTFRIWKSVFEQRRQSERLVRTAAIQTGWCDNTDRILAYLEDHGGADALAPTYYFNFDEDDHNRWLQYPSSVTADSIINAMSRHLDDTAFYECIKTTAQQAGRYGLKIAVYEAGQHMQPWRQADWPYNRAVWDAQVHPGMYDLYMKYWGKCDSLMRLYAAGTSLCCAFAYVGARESIYGSWGHLESYDQLLDMQAMKTKAPKYQALLDINTPRASSMLRSPAVFHTAGGPLLTLDVTVDGKGMIRARTVCKTGALLSVCILDPRGREVENLDAGYVNEGGRSFELNRIGQQRIASGICIVRAAARREGLIGDCRRLVSIVR